LPLESRLKWISADLIKVMEATWQDDIEHGDSRSRDRERDPEFQRGQMLNLRISKQA